MDHLLGHSQYHNEMKDWIHNYNLSDVRQLGVSTAIIKASEDPDSSLSHTCRGGERDATQGTSLCCGNSVVFLGPRTICCCHVRL